MTTPLYSIRVHGEDQLWDLDHFYRNYARLFSMKVHHGGFFTQWPGITYERGKIDHAECINIDEFSVHEMDSIMEDLGYTEGQVMYYHFLKPGFSLDDGLQPLASDRDVNNLSNFVQNNNLISVYIEHGMSNLVDYFNPRKSKVVIEEIPDDDTATPVKARKKRIKSGPYRKLLLDWNEEPVLTPNSQESLGKANLCEKHVLPSNIAENIGKSIEKDKDKAPVQEEVVNENEKGSDDEDSNGDRSSNDSSGDDDSQDSDFIVDEQNEIEDVEVDMRDFHLHVDADVEFMGANVPIQQDDVGSGSNDDLDVIENDQFESGSEPEDGVNRIRNRLLKKMAKKKKTGDGVISKTGFYLTQTFGSSMEVKDLVRAHAIETRRELKIVKNDKTRVRVECEGKLPVFDGGVGQTGPSAVGPTEAVGEVDDSIKGGPSAVGPGELKKNQGGPSQPTRSKKKDELENDKEVNAQVVVDEDSPAVNKGGRGHKAKSGYKCPWTLHVSKVVGSETWMVKTMIEEHTCLQSRQIKHFTYKFVGRSIMQQVEGNPDIPSSALQSELQRKFELGLSIKKAQRAKKSAKGELRGDYTKQYNMLRDYVLELQTSNPGTTVKLEVEPPMNPDSKFRVFRRIYICLGALKRGFKSAGREMLGLDGSFLSGPFPGQILTAVTLDSNNGIYPVAYAIVESETTNSWTWFLECLGEDLDLDVRSNYTFISDRQKGIIPAIAKVFPSAKHRFCLKDIHENMKLQWRGTAFKNHLWRCASATTVQEFNNCMLELKRYSEPAYKWLLKIPPRHWARSHFTGRAKSDVLLNNMCEALNSKTVKARKMPIIHCLEYLREYIMIKIGNVAKNIEKSKGPLTPTATRWLELNKTDANSYKAIFNGEDKYQVSGPWGDQCVVDLNQRTCSCRKWEITGIPCKHVVCVNWNMGTNRIPVDPVEAWCDPIYRLSTWKLMYQFKIIPTNGMNMWVKSPEEQTIVIPPKYHTPVGRPRKKRRLNAEEVQMSKNGKLSRKFKSVVCKKCGNTGHNKRSCKVGGSTNQEGDSSHQEGVPSQSSIPNVPTQSSQANVPTQSTQSRPTKSRQSNVPTQSRQSNVPTQSSQSRPTKSRQANPSKISGGPSKANPTKSCGGPSKVADGGSESQGGSIRASKANLISNPGGRKCFLRPKS